MVVFFEFVSENWLNLLFGLVTLWAAWITYLKWKSDNKDKPKLDYLLEIAEKNIDKNITEETLQAKTQEIENAIKEIQILQGNRSDKRRIEDDLVLIKELAALYIEQELGVLTDSSFWKKLRDTDCSTYELLRKTTNEEGNIIYVASESCT